MIPLPELRALIAAINQDATAATAGPWFLGAQNDYVYIVADRAPSLNNDDPWHEAPRTVIGKTYDDRVGDGPDAAFIVALVNNWATIAAAIDDLAAQVEELDFERDYWKKKAEGLAIGESIADEERDAARAERDALAARLDAAEKVCRAVGRHTTDDGTLMEVLDEYDAWREMTS